MTKMSKLTARQQQVFDLIQRAIERTGFPPTRAEIAAELGFQLGQFGRRASARAGPQGRDRTGRGRVARHPAAGGGPEDSPHQFTLPHASIMQLSLPLVGRVAAGSPILAQEHISQHYAFDPALFSSKPDYLLKVRGLSMRDAGIFDGDLLAVQKKSEAKDGQIVVARLGDDVTVKRLEAPPGRRRTDRREPGLREHLR